MTDSIPAPKTKKRLSLIRLLFVTVVVVGISYQTTQSYEAWQANDFVVDFEPWYAGYVDVTSVPVYAFENRGQDVEADAVLSFIVSDSEEPCTPTWGNYYDLGEANAGLDLDRRIARLQQQGGRIAVSFGGAINSELALKCTDDDLLYEAYRSVIDRYSINTIDLDLERESLYDREAGERRARVVAKLQADYRAIDDPLAIWLTLPVAPQGLPVDSTDAIAIMLEAGVDLAGVNVMVMEYGNSKDPEDTMYEASRKALLETHRQLQILYANAGTNLHDASVWKKIGATPMIGQNGSAGQVFTLDDAVNLNTFALERGIGRMSIWSSNRDIPCGDNYVDVRIVSDSCSGTDAPKGAFTAALAHGFTGDLMQNAQMMTVEDPERTEHVIDDPTTSPYPVWQEAGVYLKDTKVVWRGHVYQAKWWTKGEQPDNPVLQSWELPWQLIGPVLPGEKPIPQPKLPVGTYPQWNGFEIYDGGERVLFEGTPYQAKWWNQGDSPAMATVDPDSSPWIPLSQTQILEIMKRQSL